MNTGIIGTGRMGTAIATRLIESGISITVWNRTESHTEKAINAGAQLAGSLKSLSACDNILLSLTDAEAVTSVISVLVEQGINGQVIVDMSTLLPEETRTIAKQVIAAGGDFVDCPVGGTVGPALKGQLLGMAGGSEVAFNQVKPVLELLCKRLDYLGPVGSGSYMKLAVNLPLAIYWKTLAEALVMLEGSDIPIETAISILADSSAGPAVLKNRMQVVIDTLNGEDQPGTFDLAGLTKDLSLAIRQSADSGKSLPLAEATRISYNEALNAGLDRFDGASLSRFLK